MLKADRMFGKNYIECGYCFKTLPSKYCKRHKRKTTITKVKYTIVNSIPSQDSNIPSYGVVKLGISNDTRTS